MISCIIPFRNERERILSVVQAVIKVKAISQVICVDDGSHDGGGDLLKQNFPQINVLKLESNLGKSGAVFFGLDSVKNEIIILIDGDLMGLKFEELENICLKFVKEKSLDMLILKPEGELLYKPVDWFFRNYVIQSGNRILKTTDLKEVKKLNPKSYQLEVAINQYMLENNRNVAWIPISGFNPHKSRKVSFIQGLREDAKMNKEITGYLGAFRRLGQILFFARKKLT